MNEVEGRAVTLTPSEGLQLVGLLTVVGMVADTDGFKGAAKQCALTSLKILERMGTEFKTIQHVHDSIVELIKELD